METTEAGRLRVAYIDHVARLSGGELALLRTLPALLDRVEPLVILGEDGPLRLRLAEAGIEARVLTLPAGLRDTERTGVLVRVLQPLSLLRLARHVLALRRLLIAERIELVHTNSLKASMYGGLAGRLAGLPVLWHVRDRLSADYLSGPTAFLVRLAVHLIPEAIVTNSQSTLATLPRRRPAGFLCNPVIPDAVLNHRANPSTRGEGFSVGIVGRLSPWKGQDVFLRAFAQAFAGTPVRARIIGSAMFGEQAYADGLRPLAESLGIAEQVEFRGFQEDIWTELAELDVLVHASTVPEPFGQVVLEGLAAGVAVVASNEGGPAEIISTEVDGILVSPRDPAVLAAALRRLAVDPALRERLSCAGQVTASRYSPAATGEALLAVYDWLIR